VEGYHLPPEEGDYWDAHYLDILEQRFTLAPGQDSITLSFQYDFVTEEAAGVGDRTDTPAPDYFSAVVEIGGRVEVLTYGHVFGLEKDGALVPLDGASLSEGFPLRHTGWVPIHGTIALGPDETGPVTVRFAVADGWDRAFDSVLLVDDVSVQ
jgi:hypothetical protein